MQNERVHFRLTRGARTATRLLIAQLLIASAVVVLAPGVSAAPTEVSGWVLEEDGAVRPFGAVQHYGNSSGAGTAVSLVANSSNNGYWVLWTSGKVTAHGSASHFGDASSLSLNRPAVALSALSGDNGYIVLGEDGGIFTFGAAAFHGSVPAVSPHAAQNTRAVGLQLTSAGYRIIHDDGGVFAFGDAPFAGSIPGVLNGASLDRPIIDTIRGTNAGTYAMVATDGGVFTFGVPYTGSLGGTVRRDIVSAVSDGADGYGIIDDDGTLAWYGATQTQTFDVPNVDRASSIVITGVALGTPTNSVPTTQPPAPTTTAPPSAGAVTIWPTQTHAAGPDVYFQANFNDQSNWQNLINGDAILRLDITDKPSSKAVDIQVCGWYWINRTNFSGGFKETCSPKTLFTTETGGFQTINLGAPADWWKKNNEFPWSSGPDIMRLMIKDAATQSLMMSSLCGSACYSGSGSVTPHVPITMSASLTFNN